MNHDLGLEHCLEPVPGHLYCHSRAQINIYWAGWKLGTAFTCSRAAKTINYSLGVCVKRIFYERGWQMRIPLTLVIIGICGHILTWGRHSWVGCFSWARFKTELNSWLLTWYVFCRNVWISEIQSKATTWSELLGWDTKYRWFPSTHVIISTLSEGHKESTAVL